MWLLLQPLGRAFISGFLPLKSACPIRWPWTGSKMTPPPHTHTLDFLPNGYPCSTGDSQTARVLANPITVTSILLPQAAPTFSNMRILCAPFSKNSLPSSPSGLVHLIKSEGKPAEAYLPSTRPSPPPHGWATGDSQHSNRSLQETTLLTNPSPS